MWSEGVWDQTTNPVLSGRPMLPPVSTITSSNPWFSALLIPERAPHLQVKLVQRWRILPSAVITCLLWFLFISLNLAVVPAADLKQSFTGAVCHSSSSCSAVKPFLSALKSSIPRLSAELIHRYQNEGICLKNLKPSFKNQNHWQGRLFFLSSSLPLVICPFPSLPLTSLWSVCDRGPGLTNGCGQDVWEMDL